MSSPAALLPYRPAAFPAYASGRTGAGLRGDGSLWVRDDRFSLLLAGILWALVILVTTPEGFDYSALSTDDMPTSGSVASRLQWLALVGAGIGFVLWRGGLAWLLLRRLNPFLVAFVILAAASTLWSIEPGITLRRMIRITAIVLCPAAMVLVAWHPRRFQQVMRPIVTALLAGSLVFGLAFPHLAIHSESAAELAGAWRGLTNHKNSLGTLACLGLIFWLHAGLVRETRLPIAVCGAAVATACLFLSRSSTALVTGAFTCIFLLMLLRSPKGLRRWMPWLTALFVTVLLAYSLAVLRLVPGLEVLLSPVTAITGKDLTFTGRTGIWAIVIEQIRLHPWLGSGYGAYWIGPVQGSPAYEMVRLLYFYPGSAHNGYLDIANDLGSIGLLVLLGYLIVHVGQSLQLLRIDRGQAALYLAIFFQQALNNLSESHWLNVTTLSMVVMTAASLALARALLENRLRDVFGQPRSGAGRAAASPSPAHVFSLRNRYVAPEAAKP